MRYLKKVPLKNALLVTTCVGASLALAPSAQAQASDAEDLIDDGEIIVTAQRESTLASKTPVAITALSGDDLRSSGISNPTNLSQDVPSLSIDRNNGGLQITIRGVSSSDLTEKGDPSVAFLLDGIYIARPQAQEVSFFDIERIEVLRGPQGTLYGRNTTAGLINVLANKPVDHAEASVDAAVGNFGTYQASAMVNLPVTDSLAIRASANLDRRDNYLTAGDGFDADLDPAKNNLSGRLQALYSFDRGSLLVRADYASIKGKNLDTVLTSNFYSGFDESGVDPEYIASDVSAKALRSINAPVNTALGRDNESWGGSVEFNYDFGPINLTYLGSYRELERHENGAYLMYDGSDAYPTRLDASYWQNSQELRFATSGDGPLKLQAGVYYFKEHSSINNYAMGILADEPGEFGYIYGFPQSPAITESWAGFAQATYAILPTLRLTGGVRYSADDKSRNGATIICGTLACDAADDMVSVNDASRSFDKVTWRAGLDWDLDPTTLVYGTVSTGYKAGGFNDGCLVGQGTGCTLSEEALYYQPETVTAYELGVKTKLLDNRLRLGISAFHYDYTNIQLSQMSDICGGPCRVTTNAGKASVDGVELEGTARLSPLDEIGFFASLLDAHYTEFMPDPEYDWSGRKLDRSPGQSASISYAHTFPLASGADVEAKVQSRYSSHYYLAALNTLNQLRVPSYTKTNLSITYTSPAANWYVQGYANNLENSIVVTTASTDIFGSAYIADPRTYGVRAGIKF